ncbi:sulfotransferase [Luteimonas sp. 8-5]|uniref:sulfotransferase family protein n=1 Tax=Luteimonas sp. 8-5 TaxID=3039387 RepID=UPI0024372214|nr:sulfotransferase [Luteimonas sp. 8-5]MDG6348871.1 sulfotransferase [Luteimonas sp. 8-5]
MSAPLIRFLVGGVQKAGTTALARYLSGHPHLRLPLAKEAHVFDRPDFDEASTSADIDRLHAPLLPRDAAGALCGDATPFYVFHPRLVARIARYNPGMRWIVLLRHPVDRALSQYHMERERGHEPWPLWPALLLERWRLRRHWNDFSPESPLRRHSYLARGDYARQLSVLYAHFPREQVLLLRSRALRDDPAACLARTCAFLGVPSLPQPPEHREVFTGNYPRYDRSGPSWRLARWLLRKPLARLREEYGIDFEAP